MQSKTLDPLGQNWTSPVVLMCFKQEFYPDHFEDAVAFCIDLYWAALVHVLNLPRLVLSVWIERLPDVTICRVHNVTAPSHFS